MTSGLDFSDCAALQARIIQLEEENTALRAQLLEKTSAMSAYERHSKMLKGLVNLLPIGVAIHHQGVATFINPMGLQIMKAQDDSEILGKPAIEFVHPDYRADASQRIQRLLHNSNSTQSEIASFIEEKFIRPDGVSIDVEVAAFSLDRGDDRDIIVIFRDVTRQKRQRRELEENERRFRQLVSILPDAVIVHRNFKILFANEAAARLLHATSPQEMAGQSILSFIHEDEREKVHQRYALPLGQQIALPLERERYIRSDGGVFWAEIAAIPFVAEDEDAVLVVLRDVTTQESMIRELAKSEKRFRTLVNLLPAAVFIIGESGDLIFINTESENVSGYTVEESLAMDFSKFIGPELYRETEKKVEELAVGESFQFELSNLDSAENCRWFEVTLLKTLLDGEKVIFGVAFNISWRKKTERQLKELAQRLVVAYEEERGHIARELHDEVGQQLIGMKFALENASRHIATEQSEIALQEARGMLSELMIQVREMALSFRPAILDDLGLLPTLLWYFERYAQRYDIHVSFNHADIDRRFADVIEITAYRIVQEALTNVARHAQVHDVDVSVRATDQLLHIRIQDDGVGFDVDEALEAYASRGLAGMQERVGLLGGNLHITSEPGAGATIIVALPLYPPDIERERMGMRKADHF